jgi:hypothetical protein
VEHVSAERDEQLRTRSSDLYVATGLGRLDPSVWAVPTEITARRRVKRSVIASTGWTETVSGSAAAVMAFLAVAFGVRWLLTDSLRVAITPHRSLSTL